MPSDTPDFTRRRIENPDIRAIATARLESNSAPGLLRLSSSHVDAFRLCPFAYLWTRALSIDQLELTVNPDDPAEIGRLYHDILADFFEELATDGVVFRSEDLPELRRRLSRVADRLHARHRGMIPAVVYDARRLVFDRIARALLESDAGLIDGHEPILVEAWQREQEVDEGYLLVGRVDRATRAPDGTITLVDYKKSRLPTKVSVNAGSETAMGTEAMTPDDRVAQASRLESVQVPLYVRLLEAGGLRVGAAGYYSLEQARYLSVFGDGPAAGKPAMDRDRLLEVMGLVDDIVTSMVARINEGDFTCEDECAGCPLRSVCRTRYHVR